MFRYVTEGTFDAYLYQMIENKQRFISQIMTSKSPVRSCEDVDEATLSYAEVKALCAGNPLIKEKMDLDVAVTKLKMLKSTYVSQQYQLEDDILKDFPQKIRFVENRIKALNKDLEQYNSFPKPEKGISPMTINGKSYTDKEAAGNALMFEIKGTRASREGIKIGSYKGFDMMLSYNYSEHFYKLALCGKLQYAIDVGDSAVGNITRLENALENIKKYIGNETQRLEALNQQLDTAKSELGKPFPQEQELAEKSARLAKLNIELDLNKKDEPEKSENAEEVEEDKPSVIKQIKDIKAKSEQPPGPKPNVPPEKKEEQEI